MAQVVETPEIASVADGSTASFPIPFTFIESAEVKVSVLAADGTRTDQVEDVDYVVSGANVVFLAGHVPAAGSRVERVRRTPAAQPEAFGDDASFRPQANEDAFDRLTRQVQEVRSGVDRALLARVGETGVAMAPLALRGGTLWVWSDDGLSLRTDRTLTAFDADVAQAAADRVQTGLDRAQTGADRDQTGEDVAAAAEQRAAAEAAAARSQQFANDAAVQGGFNVPIYASVASLDGSAVTAGVNDVEVRFYNPTAGHVSTWLGGHRRGRISKADLDVFIAAGLSPLAWGRSDDFEMPGGGEPDEANGGYWLIADPVIRPSMLGAACSYGTDDTEVIQAAVDTAVALGRRFELDQVHRVNGAVTLPGWFRLEGARGRSTIYCPSNEGVPVFEWPAGQFGGARNLYLTGAGQTLWTQPDPGDLSADSWSPVDRIGLKGGVLSPLAGTNRLVLDNIHIAGMETAIDWIGWVGDWKGVLVTYCGLALRGDNLNGHRLNIQIESCRKPVELTRSAGLDMGGFMVEGFQWEAGNFDGCWAMDFSGAYFEAISGHPIPCPYLVFGETTECGAIKFGPVTVAAYLAENVPAFVFDKVTGLDLSEVRSSVQYQRRLFKTTANTKNVRWGPISASSGPTDNSSGWLTDGAAGPGLDYNYIPNPSFALWPPRGYDALVLGNAAISEETTVVRKGGRALRLTAAAGTFNHIEFRVSDQALVEKLRGKTIRLGAWVHTPRIAAFANDDTRPLRPGPMLLAWNGTSGTLSHTKNNRVTAADAPEFSFWWNEMVVPNDAIRLHAVLYLNQSSTAAEGDEYVVIDEVSLVEACCPLWKQMEGLYQQHPSIAQAQLGRMLMKGTTAPTGANQTYQPMDEWRHTAPAASTSPGGVCVTVGTAGAAVWKSLPALGA